MHGTAETCIGLDVGGTRIRAARIGRDGTLQGHRIEPVDPTRQGFIDQVTHLIEAVRDESTLGIGIGIPGRVDSATGSILSVGYIDIAGLDLAGKIAAQTRLPVRIENDATMALIAEGRETPGLIAMVTVGTGVGGAVLLEGAPWHGGGIAGQFGHIVVADDGPPCLCGRRGCVESLSSGTALGRLIAEAGLAHTTRAEDLFAAAEAGDAQASGLLTTWAAPMQRALETLVSVLDPQRLILGGGLGGPMRRALALLPARSTWFERPIAQARLGDEAGVIGAGLAAFRAKHARVKSAGARCAQ